MTTIAERVAAGAAFLDEREPGWDLRIDLDRLSIGSSCNCILGQLHGSYSGGLMAVELHPDNPGLDLSLGFMWSDGGAKAVGREVRELTAEWRRVITGRRPAS